MAKKTDKEQSSERQSLAARRFYMLVVCLTLILLLAVGSVVLWVVTPWPVSQNQQNADSLFAVKTVTVEGNTKYSQEAVIGESGIQIGQSIFSIKSNQTEEKLMSAFPYFSSVQVQTLHMDEVHITVTETEVIGAIYADQSWVLVGENGKALEKREIVSDMPKRLLYIKGTDAPEGGIQLGGMAMDEYCQGILQTLLSAINRYELTNVTEIDMTDKTDLQLCWNGQILVKLGNSTNLEHEIGVVASTIPVVLRDRGSHVTGVLNVSSYSSDALENQAVFTPSSLLATTTTATRRPAAGETTVTSAPSAQDGDDDYSDGYSDYSDYSDDYSGEDSYGYDDGYSDD
ncbi:MAG: cell division protein FtsQ/DivIB [Acutalibacteraceae bacterium]